MVYTGGTIGSTRKGQHTYRKGTAKSKSTSKKFAIEDVSFADCDNVSTYIDDFDYKELNNFLQQRNIRSLTWYDKGFSYLYDGKQLTYTEAKYQLADDDNKQWELGESEQLFKQIESMFLTRERLENIKKIDLIVPEGSNGELSKTTYGDMHILDKDQLYLELENPDIVVKSLLDDKRWEEWSSFEPADNTPTPNGAKKDIWSLVETSSEYEGLPPLTPERLAEIKANGLETVGLNHDEEDKFRLMEAYEFVRETKPEKIDKELLIKLFNISNNLNEKNFRDTNVYLGGNHFPPKPEKIDSYIEKLNLLERSIQFNDPYLKAAAHHVAFESIHPFADSNGRIGRLLLDEIVFGNGLNFKNGTRVDYQAALRACERMKSPQPLAAWFRNINTNM